jgi:hypothetical protein
MKPRELKASKGTKEQAKSTLKFPFDENADPPITIPEALAATTANCPRHGGLIGQRGEKQGMVYLCTSCKMYKRYTKPFRPRRKIKYPNKGCL